ncbi:SRPBCC domain-containing protein [Nocardia sp. CDC160]|uniref:SRPBCC domain-containing protein n=1 Tax=Nocardia sp. CDC160 TaxID=3112166 RepID=UPI002DB69936|nr:SRPBCC domain-containing protein [Nocardia sp. CDC160]MEC3918810.1 SRPBCC domain-containing protein [Nocardia sp. CDC160]
MSLDDVLRRARPETTQIHRVIIAAPAARIWTAITEPEWTVRYGFGGRSVIEPRVGGAFTVFAPTPLHLAADGERAEVLITGTVTDYDPPSLLGVRMRLHNDDTLAAEPETLLRYEIRDRGDDTCALTIVHDVTGAPLTSIIISGDLEPEGFGGGYPFLLSDLKSLLETGNPLPVSRPTRKDPANG